MDKTGKFLVGAILLPFLLWFFVWYSAMCYGYVASQFHDWFVAPFFPVIPKLSAYGYAGLMLFVGIFTKTRLPGKEFKDEYLKNPTWEAWKPTAYSLIMPWLTYFTGYVFQYWVK
jgi:hypothetical protein